MVNTLTAEASLIVGPLVLETLVKHYFDRIKRDSTKKQPTQLRRDELLYDQAFAIIKRFLEVSTYHTVEEVQAFGNTPTPSPPWVHVVRVLIPMSCCDEAAAHITTVLGGPDTARRLVGGVKWWQVRGINGVDAQWITAKKDWQEAKRRYKMQQKNGEYAPAPESEPATYETEMDEMRCIMYLHGGGYFFGSVDQERYSIQRHARKINGRVFAINYRLAPQYPFPCALQDVLAAYLYLINPPPEAEHRPVKPSNIVIAGDSAGGGISLALLQVIRDLGLPAPAGGVLISPWCDLTHSFPSVHTNTDTDVIPQYGLSLQKPSILWPPPSVEMTTLVHASLRSRIRKTFKMDFDPTATVNSTNLKMSPTTNAMPVDVGATAPLPRADAADHQTIRLTTETGETLTITQQLHMYTQNSLLNHPLVSPCLSYLGGLPPLLFIASDKEVLRDEIIYAAHKAAYPERFTVKDSIRSLYPALDGIESRHKATSVHLQVYDDTAHIIPVLFAFTTPGKFCFRAISSFCKHVTGMTLDPSSNVPSPPPTPTRSLSASATSGTQSSRRRPSHPQVASVFTSTPSEMTEDETAFFASKLNAETPVERRRSFRRSISESVSALHRKRTASRMRATNEGDTLPTLTDKPEEREDSNSSDVGGPRFPRHHNTPPVDPAEKMAGDPAVYHDGFESGAWNGTMIRERVSTKGIIRPLEPEADLDALKVPSKFIGSISELAIRRFIEGLGKFEKKFAHTIKDIEKHRRNNLQRAKKDTSRNLSALQRTLEQDEGEKNGIKDGLIPSSGSWSWAWAIDENETPPPSSIVSRRDTEEARQLAKIADMGVFQEGQTMSANNLWSVMVNFLTATPDSKNPDGHSPGKASSRKFSHSNERRPSVFSKFRSPKA